MKKYLIILLFITSISFSQENLFYQYAFSVKIGANYQALKIGDEKVNQMAFPVYFMAPIVNNLTLTLVNNSALSSNDITNINSPGETKVGLRFVTLNNKLLLKAVTGIPTGKMKYSIEQFNLAKYLGTGSLDYLVTNYGRGFNSNIGFSFAQPLSKSFVLGFGSSYYYKGTFYPLDLPSGGSYDPGDEITGNIGLDLLMDRTTKFNLDIIYTQYMSDKIDDIKKFQAAPKFTFYSGLQFRVGKSNHTVYVLDRLKGENKLYIQGQEFLAESGNQLDVGYDGAIPINMDLLLLLNADAKIYGNIQQLVVGDMFETGKTNIISGGGGIRIFLSDILLLDIIGKYKKGKINIIKGNVEDEKDVTGMNIYMDLSFRF